MSSPLLLPSPPRSPIKFCFERRNVVLHSAPGGAKPIERALDLVVE
jgi:hypothetical protein